MTITSASDLTAGQLTELTKLIFRRTDKELEFLDDAIRGTVFDYIRSIVSDETLIDNIADEIVVDYEVCPARIRIDGE